MKYWAAIFCLLFFTDRLACSGSDKVAAAGPSGGKASEKIYKISYLPNAVLHDIYFKSDGAKKTLEAFVADGGWSWHFTTALGDGKAENNPVYQLEEKYPDKKDPRYGEERRTFEENLLKTLRETTYEPTGKTLLAEMEAVFKPYKVFLDPKIILEQWEKENSLDDIQKALDIEPHENEEILRGKIRKIIGATASVQDQKMNLKDRLEHLQSTLKVHANTGKIAEKLTEKSISGQLYHEYKKAGSLSVAEFYTELVSMTKVLGGIELTGTDLAGENQQVEVKDLMEKINEHFFDASKEPPEALPEESKKWTTLLSDFYAENPEVFPFKLKVRQILPNLLSLEEVELTFHPTDNKLVVPQAEKKGKPGARPLPDDEVKEIVQSSKDIGRFKIGFLSVDPKLESINRFYEMQRDELDNAQKITNFKTEMTELQQKIKTEQANINSKQKKKDPDTEQLIKDLELKVKDNLEKLKQGNLAIEWTVEDRLKMKKLEFKRAEVWAKSSETEAEKRLGRLNAAKKVLEDLENAGAEKSKIEKQRNIVESLTKTYQTALDAVESLNLEKKEFEKTLRDLEKAATVESSTFRFATDQGHESVVRIDSTHSDGVPNIEAGPSAIEGADISVPEGC